MVVYKACRTEIDCDTLQSRVRVVAALAVAQKQSALHDAIAKRTAGHLRSQYKESQQKCVPFWT